MNNPAFIETRHLKKYFKTPKGSLHAVDDISLTIAKGETLGVVGESGCGKSTLGKTILRLYDVTEGEILCEGKNIAACGKRELKAARKKMQMIFQDPYSSLNSRMSVEELIAAPLLVNDICPRSEVSARVAQLMDTVGLARRMAASYPHELDGGRRQRIGVARALAVEPEFIVCDEPVSALDVSIQAQILNLLMDIQEERHIAYMFITHDLSVVKHISNQIMVMYMGKCVEVADADTLFAQPLHPYTKVLLSAIPVADLSSRGKTKELIRGEISSPIDPKPGCRFPGAVRMHVLHANRLTSRSDRYPLDTSPPAPCWKKLTRRKDLQNAIHSEKRPLTPISVWSRSSSICGYYH